MKFGFENRFCLFCVSVSYFFHLLPIAASLSLSSSESICTNSYLECHLHHQDYLCYMELYSFIVIPTLYALYVLYIAFHDLFPSQNLVKHSICWRLIIDNRNKMTQVSIFNFLISFFLETFTYIIYI